MAKNLLLFLISSALSLLFLEGSLRVLMPERLAFVPALMNNELTYGPNQVQRFRHLEWDYEIRINADGFRNDLNIQDVVTNSVLVLGDSFAEGYGVPLEQTYSKVLERFLQQTNIGTHVYNAGHSSTGLPHYRRVYESVFSENESFNRVIISIFIGNDLITTVKIPNGYLRVGHELDNGWMYRVKVFLGSNVAMYAILNYVIKTNPTLARLCRNLGACDEPPSPTIYNSTTVEKAVPRTVKFIESFVETINKDHKKALLLVIPTREQVNDHLWQKVLEQNGEQLNAYRFAVNDRLVAALRAADIPVIDITAVANAHNADATVKLYFEHDGHWTENGHHTAAAELAKYLTSASGK